jgi:DNA-binding winged helix-turn-helix (wHTH) protein
MDVQFGPYRLRRHERCVDGPSGRVDIGGRSFDLLEVLLKHPNEPVSEADLFDAVWPGAVVQENTLQAHISTLRRTLASSIIVTVHGRGYKYAGPQPLPIEDGAVAPAVWPLSAARSAAERPPPPLPCCHLQI